MWKIFKSKKLTPIQYQHKYGAIIRDNISSEQIVKGVEHQVKLHSDPSYQSEEIKKRLAVINKKQGD